MVPARPRAPEPHPLAVRIRACLRRIPRGRLATYGHIAALAGNPRAARLVVRVLHACSEKDGLPWHRVINGRGTVSLPGEAGALQLARLAAEGLRPGPSGRFDLERLLWRPRGPAGRGMRDK